MRAHESKYCLALNELLSARIDDNGGHTELVLYNVTIVDAGDVMATLLA